MIGTIFVLYMIGFLKMSDIIREYDERGNIIYKKRSNGSESWTEYDENNNLVYVKSYDGFKVWYKWEDNKQIEIFQSEFEQIKRDKEYRKFLSREPISRFDLMEL